MKRNHISEMTIASNAAAIKEIRRVLDSPHRPAQCPRKGMFGRNCQNCICDRRILAYRMTGEPQSVETIVGTLADAKAECSTRNSQSPWSWKVDDANA